MLQTLTATAMNWGYSFTCTRPKKWRLRQFASYAAEGFGDIGALFPQLEGVSVESRSEGDVATFVVRAEGHVLATAYAAFTSDVASIVWDLAEKDFLRYSDKFAAQMDANVCPEKPETSPWFAAIVWPIMLHQESPSAINNLWNVLFASAYGSYALKTRECDNLVSKDELLEWFADYLDAVLPVEEKVALLNAKDGELESLRSQLKPHIDAAFEDVDVASEWLEQFKKTEGIDIEVMAAFRKSYLELWLHDRQVGEIEWRENGDDHECAAVLNIPKRRLRAWSRHETIFEEEETYPLFSAKPEAVTYLDETSNGTGLLLSLARRFGRRRLVTPSYWKTIIDAFNSCSFAEWQNSYQAPEKSAVMKSHWHLVVRSVDGGTIFDCVGDNACEDKFWTSLLDLIHSMHVDLPTFGHSYACEDGESD